MSEETSLTNHLRQRFPERVLEVHAPLEDEAVTVSREGLVETFRFLKEDSRIDLNFLVDLTVVDFWNRKDPRFELVYHLYSLNLNHRLRVKVGVSEEDPTVDSLTPLWHGANWLEREAWDLFGVRFLGHPDLRRILLYEEFQGHPLRKDYTVNQCQPLVPERTVEDTFVDRASQNRLAHLKRKFSAES